MAKQYYMRAPSGEVFTTSNPDWHKECEQLTQKAGIVARQEYCRAELLKLIKPGQTIYCVLRSVSKSGMQREISLFIATKNKGVPGIRNIDTLAADLLLQTQDRGIKQHGCGMDMGFDLVYRLGHALWPNGTRKPHGIRNGEPDKAGGYALKHSWL